MTVLFCYWYQSVRTPLGQECLELCLRIVSGWPVMEKSIKLEIWDAPAMASSSITVKTLKPY